jgi:flap endonuclease-1
MGLTGFNKLLKLSPTSKKVVKVGDLKSTSNIKRVGIEMSGYIYKFCHTKNGVPNTEYLRRFFYLFISFMKSGIVPVGIFDGKPPEIKRTTLKKRQETREKQQKTLTTMEEQLKTPELTIEQRSQIEKDIKKQKSNIIVLSPDVFSNVKNLCDYMGVPYFVANGEADALFAYLFSHDKIDAVLSEDYDMFPFGIGYILRQYNQVDNSVVQYDLRQLLTDLKITQQQLVDLCILSGCDYATVYSMNITKAYEKIQEYETLEKVDSEYLKVDLDTDRYNHLSAKREFIEGPERESSIMETICEKDIQLGEFETDVLCPYLSELCRFKHQTIQNWANVLQQSHTSSTSRSSTSTSQPKKDYLLELINYVARKSEYLTDTTNGNIFNSDNYKMSVNLTEQTLNTYTDMYIIYVIMRDRILGYLTIKSTDVYNLLTTNLIQMSVQSSSERSRIDTKYVDMIDFKHEMINVKVVCDDFQIYAKHIKKSADGKTYDISNMSSIPFRYLREIGVFIS